MARRVIPIERLQAVADLAPKPEPNRNRTNGHHGNGTHRLMVDAYLRDAGVAFKSESSRGGEKFVLECCPFDENHRGKDAAIFQAGDGMTTFHCFHDSCRNRTWHDVKTEYGEPKHEHYNPPKFDYGRRHQDWQQSQPPPPPKQDDSAIKPVTIGRLVEQHPTLREPVIDGIVRRGETVNIIANPKVGKSWMTYALALSIVFGALWLGKFRCRRGRVLIIDNELHPETAAHRIPVVAEAMGLKLEDYADHIEVVTLRGRLLDLNAIGQRIVDHLGAGQFDAIVVDAWYRVLSDDENSNAQMAAAYNLVDQYAIKTGAAWFLIHHASKGNQSEKRTTDVGAGAGAQSRAADCHLVIREHEDDGVAVLDAAVRSFPPIDPVPLRWNFPVWEPADDADPTRLKGRKTDGETKQDERDQEGRDTIVDILRAGRETRRQLRTKAGMGPDRLNRLVRQLIEMGDVEIVDVDGQEFLQVTKFETGL